MLLLLHSLGPGHVILSRTLRAQADVLKAEEIWMRCKLVFLVTCQRGVDIALKCVVSPPVHQPRDELCRVGDDDGLQQGI